MTSVYPEPRARRERPDSRDCLATSAKKDRLAILATPDDLLVQFSIILTHTTTILGRRRRRGPAWSIWCGPRGSRVPRVTRNRRNSGRKGTPWSAVHCAKKNEFKLNILIKFQERMVRLEHSVHAGLSANPAFLEHLVRQPPTLKLIGIKSSNIC